MTSSRTLSVARASSRSVAPPTSGAPVIARLLAILALLALCAIVTRAGSAGFPASPPAAPAVRIQRLPGPRLAVRGDRIDSSFARDGVTVSSDSRPLVQLGLAALGRRGSLRAVPPVSPVRHADRVVYRRRGVAEWYARNADGL